MTKSDHEGLIAALQTGIGLTRSCMIVGLDIRKVSDEIRKDNKLRESLQESITYAGKTLVLLSQKSMQSKQFDKWISNTDYIKNFQTDLILWESYSKKKDVTVKSVIKCMTIRRGDLEECATSMGMTKDELIEYIIEDKVLSSYYSDKIGK